MEFSHSCPPQAVSQPEIINNNKPANEFMEKLIKKYSQDNEDLPDNAREDRRGERRVHWGLKAEGS